MEWTEELITHLRALWDEGRSTAEIGRVIGMSKNAVVGKAHRLNLTARPSPIRREPGAAIFRPRPISRGPTLPPLPAMRMERSPMLRPRPASPPKLLLAEAPLPEQPLPEIAPAVPAAAPAVPERQARTREMGGREMACCWPLGDPGTPGFRFCGAVAAPGKPYCLAHAQVAYVRVRDRREDAA